MSHPRILMAGLCCLTACGGAQAEPVRAASTPVHFEGHCAELDEAPQGGESCVAWWGSTTSIGPQSAELCEDMGGRWEQGACPVDEALGHCRVSLRTGLDSELGEQWTWYASQVTDRSMLPEQCAQLGGQWTSTLTAT